jgi:hypothetical protein
MSTLKLNRGDHVRLISENITGVVVDVKTRSIVVRVEESSGKVHERHLSADDLERLPTTKEVALETPRDHNAPILRFALDSAPFVTIDDAHVRAERVDAWLTSLRTIYSALHDRGITRSVTLVGFHGRRVLTISAIAGAEVFHTMQSAWDAHKMRAERHDIPEQRTLDKFHSILTSGEPIIDDREEYAYAFVSVKATPAQMPPFTASVKTLLEARNAPAGLQGAVLFANDDDSHEVLFTRWSERGAAEAFAHDARTHVALPPTASAGDEAEAYEPKEQLIP